MNSGQQYIELYKQHRDTLFGHSVEAMNNVRDDAFAHFVRQGLPTRKVEDYRYTDMQPLFAPDYGLNLNRIAVSVDAKEAFRCGVQHMDTDTLYVINDQLMTGQRPDSQSEEGVFIGSVSEVVSKKPHFMEKYYAKLALSESDSVTALNTMLAQEGLVVYVPRGVKLQNTLQVVNLLHSNIDMMVNRRVLIVLEEHAEATLLFCDHTLDDCRFLSTQVTEVFVGANAKLDLYCMEETHYKNTRVSNLYIEQQRDSHVNHHVLTLHNGVTRNRVQLAFKGEGAECNLCGCVIADKQQHVDNHTLIDHQVPHCTSRELYKYVLDEQSTGAFAGRVLVRHGAQKTVSEEVNQNLCTTREARMYTQPMLEIYADDVKCSHGSTVGQLNDAALFYMQQRGISREEAKLLLEMAFAYEVIDRIQLVPLRDRLRHLVEKRFRGEGDKCVGCSACG